MDTASLAVVVMWSYALGKYICCRAAVWQAKDATSLWVLKVTACL